MAAFINKSTTCLTGRTSRGTGVVRCATGGKYGTSAMSRRPVVGVCNHKRPQIILSKQLNSWTPFGVTATTELQAQPATYCCVPSHDPASKNAIGDRV
eukprot:933416-Prymnesium_polylepis.2